MLPTDENLPPNPAVPRSPARSVPNGAVGRVVEVKVLVVGDRQIEVQLADGRPGVIERREFAAEPVPAVGSMVKAAVLARDDPKGRVVLSREWARRQVAWERLVAAHEAGGTLSGPVVRVVKGGVVVDLGMRAFLPASLVDERPVESAEALDALVGTEVTVTVVELDDATDRVVVSRREHLRRTRRAAEKEAFAALEVGSVVRGTVVAVLDYGLQVEIMGIKALLHRSEMSWGRPPPPSQVAGLGDELEAVVIELNKAKHRVGLSLRQRHADPFAAVAVGEVREATVTKVIDYGVFARIDGTEVEGLVHVSEISELPGARPDELVTPGEGVWVKVLSIDPVKRRVALSIRQALYG